MLPQAADCSAASMRPGGETAHHYFGGPDPDQPARHHGGAVPRLVPGRGAGSRWWWRALCWPCMRCSRFASQRNLMKDSFASFWRRACRPSPLRWTG